MSLFNRSFLLAIGLNLCFGLVFFMLVTSMAVYAAREFTVGEAQAGFAASAFVLGALFARIFAGKYVDLVGRRRTVLLSVGAYIFIGASYLVVDTYEILILTRLLHGAVFAFGQTALNAGVFAMIPAGRRGEGAGYYLVANSLPQALGPLLGLYLSHTHGSSALFISATAISVVALLLAVGVKLPEAYPRLERSLSQLLLRPSDVIERRAIPLAVSGMLLSFGFASMITFLDSFAVEEGMQETASLFFIVFASVVLITRLFIGRCHDHYGDNAVIYPSIAMFICAMSLMAWSPNAVIVLSAAVCAGLGHGSLVPVLQASVSSMVKPQRVSIGLSTFLIFSDTAVGLSPILLGPVAALGGYRFMWGVCAGIIVAAGVVYWCLHGRFDVRLGVRRRS